MNRRPFRVNAVSAVAVCFGKGAYQLAVTAWTKRMRRLESRKSVRLGVATSEHS